MSFEISSGGEMIAFILAIAVGVYSSFLVLPLGGPFSEMQFWDRSKDKKHII